MRAAIIILIMVTTLSGLQVFAQANKEELNAHLNNWTSRIKRNWYPPKCGPYKAPRIKFDLMADGSVQNIKVEEPSDQADADRAAIKAIKDAAPFTPFPKEWGKEKITLHGNFKIFARKGFQFLEID